MTEGTSVVIAVNELFGERLGLADTGGDLATMVNEHLERDEGSTILVSFEGASGLSSGFFNAFFVALLLSLDEQVLRRRVRFRANSSQQGDLIRRCLKLARTRRADGLRDPMAGASPTG